MPALGMAQEMGKLVAWLKKEGDPVEKGELLMEIETDKATVEIEAPATGVLRGVRAQEGDDVPVGQIIAWIVDPGEPVPDDTPARQAYSPAEGEKSMPDKKRVSPVARRMAQENRVDLDVVKADGERIRKSDVQAFLEQQQAAIAAPRLSPASPKARRLASERGLDVTSLNGSGPGGAVLAGDVLAAPSTDSGPAPSTSVAPLRTVWRVMAERVTQSWTNVPHFYLMREVNASRLKAWRESVQVPEGTRITYTDLLVRVAAAALQRHPSLNNQWRDGSIFVSDQVNISLAVAVEDGLVTPVLRAADQQSISQIASWREDVIRRAGARKLRPEDFAGGTFTISNLGMYGVDVFNAIVNAPQAAILAVGRIADRVVPLNGQPAIQPMMMLSLSCDHRMVDGARAATFLQTLAVLIEEPLGLLQ